ncbi:spindle and kinetochore-associated protein 1-like [Watersipora subatra]|uniref:spindle and kinetochore-associated protein 1-like n=1 Tax=Watersipora subatra TaxID=2589382 RepID=UPI00355B8C26
MVRMDLPGLVGGYVDKVNGLSNLADLREVLQDEDDTLINEYGTLAKNSVRLSTTFKEYREEGAKAVDLNNQLQALMGKMAAINSELDALTDKVPKYLPGSHSNGELVSEPSPVVSAPKQQGKKSLASGKKLASGEATKSKLKQFAPPVLPYLTAQEFSTVPKYMKGRILYSEANKAIDVLNQAASEKYKIVNKSKGLSEQQRRKKIDYLELESKDTENLQFVTDMDIAEQSSKVDKHFLSVLTIIRHCGRIRQLRAGKITKYVLLPVTANT